MRGALIAAVLIAGCAYDRPALRLDGDAAVDGALDDAEPDAGIECKRDEHCASFICEAGTCVPPSAIRYVATTGVDGPSCAQDQPCLTIAHALVASASTHAYVAVDSGAYPGDVAITGGIVTIVGRGLARPRLTSSGGPAINVSGGTVTLRHLQVASSSSAGSDGLRCTDAQVTVDDVIARGSTGDGIDGKDCDLAITGSQLISNGGSGLQVVGDRALVVSASVIHANAFGGAGVSTTSTCELTGTFVDGNGGTASAIGGLDLECNGGIRVENLTFANNVARDAAAASNLVCAGISASTQLVRNLILASDPPQLAGCTTSYSLFVGQVTPGPGVENRAVGTAGFVDVDGGNYHLTTSSPAHGHGDPTTTPALDVDGEGRPLGSWDVGGDEIP